MVSFTNSELHLVQVRPLTPIPHLLQVHSMSLSPLIKKCVFMLANNLLLYQCTILLDKFHLLIIQY